MEHIVEEEENPHLKSLSLSVGIVNTNRKFSGSQQMLNESYVGLAMGAKGGGNGSSMIMDSAQATSVPDLGRSDQRTSNPTTSQVA
jgi:hypothetical protein